MANKISEATAVEKIDRLLARKNELEKERAVIDAKIALVVAQIEKASGVKK